MTYSDTYNLRNRTVAKLNDIANAIDGLLVQKGRAYSASMFSGSSTSSAAVTSMSVTVTVPASGLVVAVATAWASNSTAGQYVAIGISEDSTSSIMANTMEGVEICETNDTGGYRFTLPAIAYSSPSAGSHTYRMLYRVSANTGYLGKQLLQVLVFQG